MHCIAIIIPLWKFYLFDQKRIGKNPHLSLVASTSWIIGIFPHFFPTRSLNLWSAHHMFSPILSPIFSTKLNAVTYIFIVHGNKYLKKSQFSQFHGKNLKILFKIRESNYLINSSFIDFFLCGSVFFTFCWFQHVFYASCLTYFPLCDVRIATDFLIQQSRKKYHFWHGLFFLFPCPRERP